MIIDTAIDKWKKRLQACVHANDGHFKHLLWTNSCIQFAFLCFWFKWHLPMVSVLLCWYLMVDNCKALSLLRTVNEHKVKCWYLHNVNLCTYFHDIWQISVG